MLGILIRHHVGGNFQLDTSHSTTIATPIINKASLEDMLAEKANYTPNHQPRHVKFSDMVEGRLTSTP